MLDVKPRGEEAADALFLWLPDLFREKEVVEPRAYACDPLIVEENFGVPGPLDGLLEFSLPGDVAAVKLFKDTFSRREDFTDIFWRSVIRGDCSV